MGLNEMLSGSHFSTNDVGTDCVFMLQYFLNKRHNSACFCPKPFNAGRSACDIGHSSLLYTL